MDLFQRIITINMKVEKNVLTPLSSYRRSQCKARISKFILKTSEKEKMRKTHWCSHVTLQDPHQQEIIVNFQVESYKDF